MRNSFLALTATLAFAGCGSTPANNGPELGPHDLAVVDIATGGQDGPTMLIGCMDLIACTNACPAGNTSCLNKCHKMATTQANALNKSLDDCIVAHCVTAPDGGMGPCSGTDQNACNTCVMNTQSGTSP
ncbi:MAG TPA: hypothetical protein VFF06_02235, partial [Polyangia bacterium]|nr:hypothetical protein [Polyangia bacterium]